MGLNGGARWKWWRHGFGFWPDFRCASCRRPLLAAVARRVNGSGCVSRGFSPPRGTRCPASLRSFAFMGRSSTAGRGRLSLAHRCHRRCLCGDRRQVARGLRQRALPELASAARVNRLVGFDLLYGGQPPFVEPSISWRRRVLRKSDSREIRRPPGLRRRGQSRAPKWLKISVALWQARPILFCGACRM
jgi:hypothetical protein